MDESSCLSPYEIMKILVNRFKENKGKGKTRKFRIARGKAVKM